MYGASKDASPVLSPEKYVNGCSLCPDSTLGCSPEALLPREAFIQSSLGSPSKLCRHSHAWGQGMGTSPDACFQSPQRQRGGAGQSQAPVNMGWGLRGSFCLASGQPFPKPVIRACGEWGQGDGGESGGVETWEGPEGGANYGAGSGCVQSALASGPGGEEQAGEQPATAVSVHKGQGVLCVVLDHGSHGGEQLDRNAGHG